LVREPLVRESLLAPAIVEPTGIPCKKVKKLKAKCKPGKGKLKVLVVLKDGFDGQTVTLDINTQRVDVTINGKKAKLNLKEQSGITAVTLINPAGCVDAKLVDCGNGG